MRAYLYVALLLLLIFGGIGGYLYQRFSTLAGMDFSPPPVTVAASQAQLQSWPQQLEAVGTIAAVRGVALTAEESGEIIALHFDSGDVVDAGTLLVTLNDKVEQASRDRQEANLDLAQILYQRDSKLVQQKSIPESQFDRSRADYQAALAQLAEIEARLENKRIHAPFAGTTGIRQVRVGDYIEPGTIITTLQDLSELEVDFTLPARYFPVLRQGLALQVGVAAFPERNFAARLSAIDARADAGTRNLLLRASMRQTEGLLPGMFARLRIDLGSTAELVTVPETAVTYSLHGDTVFVIEAGDAGLQAEPRVVETGEARAGRISILSGLAVGDRVVTTGQNKLFRGAPVVIDESVALQ